MPTNGGIQEYLRTCYGDAVGFLFTYMWVVLVKPCANAIIATIFADYLLGGLFGSGQGSIPPLVLKVGAVACVACVTFVNCLGASRRQGGQRLPRAETGFPGVHHRVGGRDMGLWYRRWCAGFPRGMVRPIYVDHVPRGAFYLGLAGQLRYGVVRRPILLWRVCLRWIPLLR